MARKHASASARDDAPGIPAAAGMLEFEKNVWNDSPSAIVAGVDEAGRGPLAGPVFAAAVSMGPEVAERMISGPLCGLTDSKRLSEKDRNRFFETITGSGCIYFSAGKADPEEIDSIDIRRATILAMKRALLGLECGLPDMVLVDGLPVPGLPSPSRAIVKGDSLSFLIAAASVVAKVSRDRFMAQLDAQYPQYGFAVNKGYGTAAHLRALAKFGPSPVHRRSFAPVAMSMQPTLGL